MKKYAVNGYILAGGKSSRMRKDKGLMVLNGKAVVQQIIEQLQPAVEKLFLVTGNSTYEQFGFEVIQDKIINSGPAGGIHAALFHTDKNLNFIVGCDMPFINTKGINFVIENSGPSRITLPRHDNGIEPLFGIYTKECFTQWECLIHSGVIKLHKMITHFDPDIIDVSENTPFRNNFFSNLNTMSDFENAMQHK